MQIRFLTGPRKGQTDHAERSPQTKLMIDAGMIEVVPPPPPAPLKPTWSVGPNDHGKIVLQLALPTGEVIRYGRDAESIDATFRKGYAHCLPVPERILAAYADIVNTSARALAYQQERERLEGEAEVQKQNENQAAAVVIMNAGR